MTRLVPEWKKLGYHVISAKKPSVASRQGSVSAEFGKEKFYD